MHGTPSEPTPLPEPALEAIHRTLLGEALEESELLAFVADEEMRYVAVNRRACATLGYTRQEILGMRVHEIAYEPSAPADYAEMVAVGHRTGTAMLRTKSGDTVELAYIASEAHISGLLFYLSIGVIA